MIRRQKSRNKHQLCKRGGSSGGGGGGGSTAAATVRNGYYSPSPTGSHDDIEGQYYDLFSDPREVIAEYTKLTGLSESQVTKSLEAVHDFTKTRYSDFRDIEFSGGTSEKIRNINTFIKAMPKFKGSVYRGVNFDSSAERDVFLKHMSVGNTSQIQAMSSFSSTKSVAKNFADGAAAHHIVMKVTSNHSGASIKKASNFQSEDEVLVPKGTKYRVLAVRTIGNASSSNTIIKLEEIR